MKSFIAPLVIVSTLFFSCCTSKPSTADANTPKAVKVKQKVNMEGLSKAYFASGCFWCVEAVYESVIGVEESISGYSGGHTENPTYQSSNTGRTGHAEAVEIHYDPEKVSFATLVDVYFGSQNITQVNGCLLYTSPSPRDKRQSRMPSSA